MDYTTQMQRPISRIEYILPKISKLWHHYPELSLHELVREITLAANQADSEFPKTSVYDIEDIAYPEGHLLHASRYLEMGIEVLEREHEHESLPPVPIQTALLGKVADRWSKMPEMRLGQMLSNDWQVSELKAESEE